MSEVNEPVNIKKPKWAAEIDDEIYHSVFKIICKTAAGKNIDQDISPFFNYDYLADPSGDELVQAIADIAGIIAFWSMVLADAKLAVNIAKRRVLNQRGKVMKSIIQQARIEGVQIPRRGDVEDLIEDDPELNKREAMLMHAEAVESKLLGVVISLRTHADSLRSLAGFKKAELAQQ